MLDAGIKGSVGVLDVYRKDRGLRQLDSPLRPGKFREVDYVALGEVFEGLSALVCSPS